MTLSTILIVILVLALFGGFVPWGGPIAPGAQPRAYPGYGFGFPVGGTLGLVLLILLILMLVGRI